MLPTGPMLGVGFVLVLLLGLAVHTVRQQDKEIAVKDMAIALAEQAAKHKDEMQAGIVAVQEKAQIRVALLSTSLNEANADLDRRAYDAEKRANDLPIAFGDEFVTDLLRLDCLWNLGERESDPSARAACVREARMANNARKNLPITVINAGFREVWVEACDDWKDIGRTSAEDGGSLDLVMSELDWAEKYPGFDYKLCEQTVVAFTPEFSYYFRKFLGNAEAYTARLTNFAKENRELLDKVTDYSTTSSN